MKKSVIQKLEKVAATLPEDVLEYRKISITGKELMAEGQTRDIKGKPLVKGKNYLLDRPFPMNHLAKLKAAYKLSGDAGVSKYSVYVTKLKSDQNKKKAPVVNTI